MGSKARSRHLAALGLGAAVGFCLWMSWEYLLGKGLPLDGGAPYLGLLFAAGAGLAAFDLADPWAGVLGLYLGQSVALVGNAILGLDPHRELVPLRQLYLVSITLAAALGAGLCSAARIWLVEVVRKR